MNFKRLFLLFSILCTLTVFVEAAGIDLNDPLQTGQTYSPSVPTTGGSYIEGNLYTTSGDSLRNGKVFVSVGANLYVTYSDLEGYFRLNLPFGDLPTMLVLQVEAEGYVPESQVHYTDNLGRGRHSFKMMPLTENYIIIDPRLHHLGDDLYSGIKNSQFQMPTKGPKYETTFNLPIAVGQIERALLKITVKGAESNNPVQINGQRVGFLRLNNNFGNSGEWVVEVPTNVLRTGSNTLTISSQFENDYDDFEFSNVRLELFTKKVSNPPQITVHEPLDNSQIVSYQAQTPVTLKATVTANNNINWIRVNGKSISGFWGRTASINEVVYLQEGANTIAIEVQDISGQISRRNVNVTVVGYPQTSMNIAELFSVSYLNSHQNALRYLRDITTSNTTSIYYPMWGEENFHESFVSKYRFLDSDKIELPSIFSNGQTKITNFISTPSGYRGVTRPELRTTYTDTSIFNRVSGRLTVEYVPSNFTRDIKVFVTLAEAPFFQNYLEAKEVFEYTITRSYSSNIRILEIPVSFSTNRRANYSYVVSFFDSSSKALLYSTVY
ncbi:MAG: hypothetical protein PHC96_02475 [Firmicutes bacterium]|nr:hypothetical protein [Bacillota bacterium]